MPSQFARTPVLTVRLHHTATPVTTLAWTQVILAMTQPASGVEIYDSSGRILEISLGDLGSEAAEIVKYTVTPNESSVPLPIEFPRGKRVSVRAVDSDTSEGWLILNFFG